MTVSKSTGRAVGLLLLVHSALIVPYVLLMAVSLPAGAFLETAAPMAGTVRLSILMLILGAAALLGIAVLLWPVVFQRQHALGLWLLVLAAINLTLQLVENAHWLSLLSLSQAYVSAGGADSGTFQALGVVAYASFRWAHYSHILSVVICLFVLFLLLYRGAMVPRPLAAFGMIAALLHFIGTILPMYGGYQMPRPDLFGMPFGLAIPLVGLWLVVKGFSNPTAHTTG